MLILSGPSLLCFGIPGPDEALQEQAAAAGIALEYVVPELDMFYVSEDDAERIAAWREGCARPQ